MKAGGTGGSSTITGLNFENKVDFLTLLRDIPNYRIEKALGSSGHKIYYRNKLIAKCFKKHDFYRFLDKRKINWKSLISKKLLPDDALLVIACKTLFIIEVKYQQVPGSVDEKLQTCDFKRKQYIKLVSPLGLRVEYVYVLNNWFKKPEYKDVLDYIHSVNCRYEFNILPLARLGLPA
ncbi:MAG: hypothetical protein OXU43_05220 [Gammaproteobacteria bacterium]|nr:hypothetical protein [Gammaproteobacteria bacterium]